MVVIMLIVWSVVIAAALLAEFLMYNFVSSWFAVGGFAALISAPAGLFWPWQILVFFGVSFIFLLSLRPVAKRFIDKRNQTVPTNLDANVGIQVKLTKDCEDGISEILIGDTFWKVVCPDGLKTGDKVEISGMKGNKYIVKGVSK